MGSLPNFKRVSASTPDDAHGAATLRPQPRTRSFGELELDFNFEAMAAPIGHKDGDPELPLVIPDEPPPSSGARIYTTPTKKPSIQTRATRQGLEAVRVLAEEETRIAKAGALEAAISQSMRPDAMPSEASTKIATLDSIKSVKSIDKVSSASGSASGVASRSGRIDEMRELYAKGEADAALALAASVAGDLDLVASEPEPFADDPFGGLIPVDDEPGLDLVPPDDDFGVLVNTPGAPIPGVIDGFGGLEPIYDEEEDFADHTAILDASSPDSGRHAALTALTSQSRTPRLLITPREISGLPMDPRAAFLLGHVDGKQSMEEILDVCAMPESEALELLDRLRSMGVIAID